MVYTSSSRVHAFLLVSTLTFIAQAQPHGNGLKLRVISIAKRTSVHTDDAQNEDVYLASIASTGSERVDSALVKLIDEYPSYRRSLSKAVLSSKSGPILTLRRDADCDIARAEMPLRTAPGNPVAILPEVLSYAPLLPAGILPNTLLPCYRLVRK